jgi:hypothetical protein
MEFVAEQLFQDTANNSDVISLVEFSESARIVFSREPTSWVLYNKSLARRDSRTFTRREEARVMDLYRCDSNYLPALNVAEERLLADGSDDDGPALRLIFLSDGAPSDARQRGLTPLAAQEQICLRLSDIAKQFGDRLRVTMVGFGEPYQEFSVLKAMVEAVKEESGPRAATFMFCDKAANVLSRAITSAVSSLAATKTTLLERAGKSRVRTERNIPSEAQAGGEVRWDYFEILEHLRYRKCAKMLVHDSQLPPGSIDIATRVAADKKHHAPPPCLALKRNWCGKGAERLAFRCNLADKKDIGSFQLGAMVAKEPLCVQRVQEHIGFHKCFCEQQNLASYLANEFSFRLSALPDFDATKIPNVSFLECSVLRLHDPVWYRGSRGVLVEKMLDTEKCGWFKWNDNGGGIDGKAPHFAIDVDGELAEIHGTAGAVMEPKMTTKRKAAPTMSRPRAEARARPPHVITFKRSRTSLTDSQIVKCWCVICKVFTTLT